MSNSLFACLSNGLWCLLQRSKPRLPHFVPITLVALAAQLRSTDCWYTNIIPHTYWHKCNESHSTHMHIHTIEQRTTVHHIKRRLVYLLCNMSKTRPFLKFTIRIWYMTTDKSNLYIKCSVQDWWLNILCNSPANNTASKGVLEWLQERVAVVIWIHSRHAEFPST